MHNTLEKHKFFPYIAWGIVIGFVLFTYSLTVRLTQTTSSLDDRTQNTVSALNSTR